jgi:hypothetical protein
MCRWALARQVRSGRNRGFLCRGSASHDKPCCRRDFTLFFCRSRGFGELSCSYKGAHVLQPTSTPGDCQLEEERIYTPGSKAHATPFFDRPQVDLVVLTPRNELVNVSVNVHSLPAHLHYIIKYIKNHYILS